MCCCKMELPKNAAVKFSKVIVGSPPIFIVSGAFSRANNVPNSILPWMLRDEAGKENLVLYGCIHFLNFTCGAARSGVLARSGFRSSSFPSFRPFILLFLAMLGNHRIQNCIEWGFGLRRGGRIFFIRTHRQVLGSTNKFITVEFCGIFEINRLNVEELTGKIKIICWNLWQI